MALDAETMRLLAVIERQGHLCEEQQAENARLAREDEIERDRQREQREDARRARGPGAPSRPRERGVHVCSTCKITHLRVSGCSTAKEG